MPQFNAPFNYIALSVPDAQAAVEWYTGVFGFQVIIPTTTRRNTNPEGGQVLTSMYGPGLKEMKLAILSCSNDVAMEIFQFVDPPSNGPTTTVDWNPDTYTRGGVFHFCLTVPDVEATVAETLTAGARCVGGTIEPLLGQKACYLQDPWGNTLELLSCTINQLYLAMIGSASQSKE